MGIESHALDRAGDSEHALVADTGTFDLADFGLPVGGDLELMKTLSMEVGRAYCQSASVHPSRSAELVGPSAGVELPVRMSNQVLEPTATVPVPISGEVPGAVTPAAVAPGAPSLPWGAVHTSCRVAVSQLDR
jgi:hypothetical protein